MSHNSGYPGKGGSLDLDELPKELRLVLKDFPIEMDAAYAVRMLRSGCSVKELLHKLETFKSGLSNFNPENKKRGI